MAHFRDIFNLPAHVIPFGLAIIGWPDQQPTTRERFDPSRIHYNAWEGKTAAL